MIKTPDRNQNTMVQPFDLADRMIQSDDIFGDPGTSLFTREIMPPASRQQGGLHWIAFNGFCMAIFGLESTQACLKLRISFKAKCPGSALIFWG